MYAQKKWLCVTLFILCFFDLAALPANDSIRYEILLSGQMLQSANMDPHFIGNMEITPERYLLLSSKNQFYLLGWGGITALGKTIPSGSVSSFAYTSDSLLMIVNKDQLCTFSADGSLTKQLNLPGEDMALCAGKEVMYLFDRSQTKGQKAIYVLAQGGKYAILLEVDMPVTSVLEWKQSLLFSCGNRLCEFDLKTKNYKVLATLAEGKRILSVTADKLSGRIYFSTDASVYAVNENCAITVSDGIGGIVRFYDGGLMIFSPEKQFLVRLVGIEEKLKEAAPVQDNTMTGSYIEIPDKSERIEEIHYSSMK